MDIKNITQHRLYSDIAISLIGSPWIPAEISPQANGHRLAGRFQAKSQSARRILNRNLTATG